MQFQISKDGIESGPFSEAEVRAKLASGEVSGSDLAWDNKGAPMWRSLDTFFCVPGAGDHSISPPASPRRRAMVIVGLVMGALVLAGLAASLVVPSYCVITHQSNQMKAASNCRQIIGLLLAYAAENNGKYPDSVPNPITGMMTVTSNDVFRALFQEGLTLEEKIFSSPSSKFVPDGHVGNAPHYEEALKPGENHWAMTAGLTSASPSQMPLVFENPANPAWPPRWDADAGCKPVRGRAWRGGKILVGRNDASVVTLKLDGTTGILPVAASPDGTNVFSQDGKTHRVLDIAP